MRQIKVVVQVIESAAPIGNVSGTEVPEYEPAPVTDTSI